LCTVVASFGGKWMNAIELMHWAPTSLMQLANLSNRSMNKPIFWFYE